MDRSMKKSPNINVPPLDCLSDISRRQQHYEAPYATQQVKSTRNNHNKSMILSKSPLKDIQKPKTHRRLLSDAYSTNNIVNVNDNVSMHSKKSKLSDLKKP